MVALNGNLTQGQECGCRSQATSERFVSLCLGGETDSLPAGRCSPASRGKLLIIERIADAYGNTIIITANWGSDSATQSAYGANDIIFCGYPDRGIATAVIGTGLYDPETQLYYVRNRTYSPPLGRWIQRDPIGYSGGINLYEYVGGRVEIGLDSKGTNPGNKQCCGVKSNCCGPDVTAKLIALAGIIRNEWNSLSFWQKARLDWDTTSVFTAGGAWDTSLVGSGIDAMPCHEGTGKCKNTVTVSGKCYWQPAVNYWLAGLIYSAMASSWLFWPDAQRFNDLVFYYVHLIKPLDHPGWKMDWYYAGIRAVTSNVPEPHVYSGCRPCKTKAATLTWKWGFLNGSI